MPQREKDEDSMFEAEEVPEQPIKPKKLVTAEPVGDTEPVDDVDEDTSTYDEILPDLDCPDGTIFSLSVLTDEDGDKFACISIDNTTIDISLVDFVAMLVELRTVEADLRRLSKA
jgi:hypothetical protein